MVEHKFLLPILDGHSKFTVVHGDLLLAVMVVMLVVAALVTMEEVAEEERLTEEMVAVDRDILEDIQHIQ